MREAEAHLTLATVPPSAEAALKALGGRGGGGQSAAGLKKKKGSIKALLKKKGSIKALSPERCRSNNGGANSVKALLRSVKALLRC